MCSISISLCKYHAHCMMIVMLQFLLRTYFSLFDIPNHAVAGREWQWPTRWCRGSGACAPEMTRWLRSYCLERIDSRICTISMIACFNSISLPSSCSMPESPHEARKEQIRMRLKQKCSEGGGGSQSSLAVRASPRLSLASARANGGKTASAADARSPPANIASLRQRFALARSIVQPSHTAGQSERGQQPDEQKSPPPVPVPYQYRPDLKPRLLLRSRHRSLHLDLSLYRQVFHVVLNSFKRRSTEPFIARCAALVLCWYPFALSSCAVRTS